MTRRLAYWARHTCASGLGVKNETTVAFDDNQDDLPAIRFGAKLFGHTDAPLQSTLAVSSKVRKSPILFDRMGPKQVELNRRVTSD